jgi:POTE ankyrin domain family protein
LIFVVLLVFYFVVGTGSVPGFIPVMIRGSIMKIRHIAVSFLATSALVGLTMMPASAAASSTSLASATGPPIGCTQAIAAAVAAANAATAASANVADAAAAAAAAKAFAEGVLSGTPAAVNAAAANFAAFSAGAATAAAASANAHVTAATATVGVIVACAPKP